MEIAVLDSKNIVINTIVADSIEIAEQVTGETCVEFDDTNPAIIGEKYDPVTKTFARIPPTPSWTWVDGEWVPPVPQPTDGNGPYLWDEETTSWVKGPDERPVDPA